MSVDVDIKVETTKSVAPRLHATHCDPNVDIVIISRDNVEFRASSFQLSKISKFFFDAFTLPPPPPPSDDKDNHNDQHRNPIYLDFPEKTISTYLDLMTIPKRFHSQLLYDISDPYLLGSLLDLCEYTISDEDLVELVRGNLETTRFRYPFELLIIASKRDDLSLAQGALENFNGIPKSAFDLNGKEWGKNWDKIKSDFRKLSPEYQAELFTLLFLKCSESKNTRTKGCGTMVPTEHYVSIDQDDWDDIRNNFDPSTPMESKLPPVNNKIPGSK